MVLQGLGRPITELKREADHWFWALEAITAENPIPEEAAGKVGEMAAAWIERGQGKVHIDDGRGRTIRRGRSIHEADA